MNGKIRFLINRWVALFIIGLLFGVSEFVNPVSASDTKYEWYETGNDNTVTDYASKWYGQSFTVGTVGTNQQFKLTSAKMLVYRVGTIGGNGKVYMRIRSTSSGLPTGADLDYSYVLGSSIGTSTSGYWIEWLFTGGILLDTSTQYAIFLNNSGDGVTYIKELCDSSSPTYSGGCYVYSSNSGSSWSQSAATDVLFDIYGILANYPPVQNTPSPSNGATNVLFSPKLTIAISDHEGNSMTCYFRSNYTGSWSTLQTNSSCSNGTYRYSSYFHSWGKKYWWSVNVTDSHAGYTNATYSFTLKANTPPSNTLSQPLINQVIISQPIIIITVSDIDKDPMNDTIRSNYTGTWKNYIFTNNTLNTTLSYSYNYYLYNHTTYWSSNLTDNHSHWSNNTYSFYLIKTQSINLSIYNNHINTTHTLEYSYTFNYGYKIYDNDTGITTPLHTINTTDHAIPLHFIKFNSTGWWFNDSDFCHAGYTPYIINCTGSTYFSFIPGYGYSFVDQYTGITTPFHHFTNYSLNVTGTHIYKLNATGYWDWANATGTGNGTGGFNLSNITINIQDFSFIVLIALTLFFIFMGYAMRDRKQGAWFLIFAGIFYLVLMMGIIAIFSGVWWFISPVMMLFGVILIRDAIIMLNYGKKSGRN